MFNKLIGAELAARLSTLGIVNPTDIQSRAIPIVAAGKDLIAQSPTGTGKTLAYLLPILARPCEAKAAQAVVAAPTYELAAQIAKVARQLLDAPEDVALLIGAAGKARQLEALKKKPRLVVGTISRILEFIAGKKLSVHHVKTLVFDEADRLFTPENMGDIGRLVKATLRERQILLFSAKIPDATRNLALPLMKQPEILVPPQEALPTSISHFGIMAAKRDKFAVLRKLIHVQDVPRAIVFVNRPFEIERVTERLNYHKLPASPLYGAAEGVRRKKALDDFRAGRIRLLVASDVGARGLDVAELAHVINLDLPDSAGSYLHRAGRCGRMGNPGWVYSIVTTGEAHMLEKFSRQLSFTIEDFT